MGDFFQTFIMSRSTEILIESNFLSGMFRAYILKMNLFIAIIVKIYASVYNFCSSMLHIDNCF